MRDYPQFSFGIPIALPKICFPRIVINLTNTSVLVGKVLNTTSTPEMLWFLFKLLVSGRKSTKVIAMILWDKYKK